MSRKYQKRITRFIFLPAPVPTMGAFSSLVILMSLNRPSRSDSKVDKEVRTLSRHVRVNEPLGSSYKKTDKTEFGKLQRRKSYYHITGQCLFFQIIMKAFSELDIAMFCNGKLENRFQD